MWPYGSVCPNCFQESWPRTSPCFLPSSLRGTARAKNELGKSSSHWLGDSGPWGWGGLLHWDSVQRQGGTSPCNMLELAQGDRAPGPVSWSSGVDGLPAHLVPLLGPFASRLWQGFPVVCTHLWWVRGLRCGLSYQAAHPDRSYLALASMSCKAET